MLKVAVGLTYYFIKSKGAVIIGKYLFKINYLVLVYNAQQNALFGVRVCAYSLNFSSAVPKLVGYLFGDFIGVGGDNGEFVGCFGTFYNIVAHKIGYKAVGAAKGNGLIIGITAVRIDE